MLTRAEKIRINREHRANDESHLRPIHGRFNVADRAIRQAWRLELRGIVCETAEEYDAFLTQLEGIIVNDPHNW